MLQHLKNWARAIKRDVVALHIAGRDYRTPRLAKLVAFMVALYALSPIDLIPDFIPVLGYLDDLLIVPAGIMLAIKLIPPVLMIEFRAAAVLRGKLPFQNAGIFLIVATWAFGLLLIGWFVYNSDWRLW